MSPPMTSQPGSHDPSPPRIETVRESCLCVVRCYRCIRRVDRVSTTGLDRRRCSPLCFSHLCLDNRGLSATCEGTCTCCITIIDSRYPVAVCETICLLPSPTIFGSWFCNGERVSGVLRLRKILYTWYILQRFATWQLDVPILREPVRQWISQCLIIHNCSIMFETHFLGRPNIRTTLSCPGKRPRASELQQVTVPCGPWSLLWALLR